MIDMKVFYKSFYFLETHPIFKGNFQDCVDCGLLLVDPETHENVYDESEDSIVRVWLECGPYDEDSLIHDLNLDCYGDSYEECIIKLAEKVEKKYGTPSEDEKIKSGGRRSHAYLILD